MKLMKRFLMFAAIAGALVIPFFALAANDDAIQTNVWMTLPPADNPGTDTAKWLTNDNGQKPVKIQTKNEAVTGNPYQVLKENQTAWFCVSNVSDTCYTSKGDGLGGYNTLASCEQNADSATLYLPSGRATACFLSDIATLNNEGAAIFDLTSCFDSRCLALNAMNTWWSGADGECEGPAYVIGESGGAGPGFFYSDIRTGVGTGETACIRVTSLGK